MIVDETGQQVFMTEILPASAVAIELIKDLRYFASYCIGPPNPPFEPFRRQGGSRLPEFNIRFFYFPGLRVRIGAFLPLGQKIDSYDDQCYTQGQSRKSVLRLLYSFRFLLF